MSISQVSGTEPSPLQTCNESDVLHTSSADLAGSEMPYLLNAITRNVYVVDGTRFWYEMRYS